MRSPAGATRVDTLSPSAWRHALPCGRDLLRTWQKRYRQTVDAWLGRALFPYSAGSIEQRKCQRSVEHREYRRQHLARQHAVERIFERVREFLVTTVKRRSVPSAAASPGTSSNGRLGLSALN